MREELSEQELARRKSLENLQKIGINPYPSELFEINNTSKKIKDNYIEGKLNSVVIAGRLMSKRIMGKAAFAELQDAEGKIQLYINRDEICPEEDKEMYNSVFKKLIDIGDILGIKGDVFLTKVGEISIKVKQFTLLAKSLRPLPLPKTDSQGNVHDSFTNTEKRYRQRYLDLVVNPEVKKTFINRSKLINSIREFLNLREYLEVETPILQPIYGGAAARPFKTHHNTLNMPLYLRIANELYLKRLIVGGFNGVYEFAKDFRNEGMSRFHNPEFTQLEIYVAYKDYLWMMDLLEEMVEKICLDLHGKTEIPVGEQIINFKRPWKRYTMHEVIEKFTGIDVAKMDEKTIANTAKKLGVAIENHMGKGKLIDEIFEKTCEKKLIQPTFIMDYPIEMSPLAKKHRSNKDLVERFEVICNGKELCNAFSELNDPIDQRSRFEDQVSLSKKGDEEAMVLDEDFLKSIEHGMPPTAGIGIGIDRLSMIMTNSSSIQDVLFFPQMKNERPQKKDS